MKTFTGDLLLIERGVILHQVNCRGVTGGLAGALRRKFPGAFASYFAACVQKTTPIGKTVVGVASERLFIAHVFGQVDPGANTDLSAVDSALEELAEDLTDIFYDDLPLFAPHLMGCGLGGGRWDQYLPLLEKHLPQLTLVKLPA